MKPRPDSKKAAILITSFLVLLSITSLAAILMPAHHQKKYIADIFQNGTLIMSISLDKETECRTFTIEGENGGMNEVEVRPGSIGILSADCPDGLCVRQGFISDTRLPIVCLPNRLVIQLRKESDTEEEMRPDTITY